MTVCHGKGIYVIILCFFLFYLDLIQFSFFCLLLRPITANFFSTVFSLKDNTQIDYIIRTKNM